MKARTVRKDEKNKNLTVGIEDTNKASTAFIDSKIQTSTYSFGNKTTPPINDFTVIVCNKCQSRYKIKKQIKKKGQKINCPNCRNILTLFPSQPKPEIRPELFFKADEFKIIGELGEGGMGKVYLAKDTQLQRNVAIKVLKDSSRDNRTFFIREAQITGQLDHPNIVPLYMIKIGDKGNQNISFVMKHIEGHSLSKIIRKAHAIYRKNPSADLEKSLTLQSRLEYFTKVCEGIAYAHSKNVIHSDLKLSNITVGDYGEVYIMDWGIAKITNDDFGEDLIETNYYESAPLGEVSLTIKYASPEQINGKTVDTLSDIFSLGIILYELVTLKAARNASIRENIVAAKKGKINSISHAIKGRKVAPELKAIIQKATEYYPQNRYQNVEELINDIRSFISSEEVSVQPYNFYKKTWRWMSKNKELTIIGTLSLILLLCFFTTLSVLNEKKVIKEAKMREYRFAQLQTDTSSQAHAMDSHFLYIEGLLKRLAVTTEYLLNEAPENNEKVFYVDDFTNPDTAPSDYRVAPLYNKYVSLDYPVAKLAPGVKKEDVSSTLKKIAPLRYHYFRAMVESNKSSLFMTDAEMRN
ncbi:MAG: serine/threonine-protein kinase, partial [Desulfobacteraceae bacterium]